MTKIITHELLRSWLPCNGGYKRFCELFPEGADLKTAVEGLVAEGHDDWGYWLFTRCRDKGLFGEYTANGYRNAGNGNAGNGNAGHWNAGNRNAGDWNAGNGNAGHFNTTTPDTILVFNKPCSVADWDSAKKPDFLYFETNEWIDERNMSDEEKIANPKFYVMGGYLKNIDFKTAFKKAWKNADKKNRALIKKLPNFDAEIFFEISGIYLREGRSGNSGEL